MSDRLDPLKLEEFLPYRLSILSNTVSRAIASSYARQFQLSIPEWRVMAVLGRFPGLSAVDVAERTAMDKVAVSRALARLIEAGRVNRRASTRDRRRSKLQLSAEGEAVYRKVKPIALRYEQALLDGLSAEDQRSLDSLLTRLLEKAKALDSEQPAQ